MRLLDRYVLKNFLVPFLYCFLGFVAIWLVFELNDDGRDFLEAKVPVAKVVSFYITQLPQIVVVSLPVGILLALLFCLSRMSRSNEIISMLTAGVSIPRLLLPLFVVGLLASGLNTALNYSLSPRSEGTKKALLDEMMQRKSKKESLGGQLFKNRTDGRIWYAQTLSLKDNTLRGAHIIQERPEGGFAVKYYARRAEYNPATGKWKLRQGMLSRYDERGSITENEEWLDGEREIEGWNETPYRIASAAFDPQTLGVPELKEYLKLNADLPEVALAGYRTHLAHRWALPWQCFIAVIIAAPLGIVNTRRGVLAGVASSIFIFFGVIFLEKLFLALGKGARIPPVVAAWGPNAVFFMLGVYLLYLRSNNREGLGFLNFLKRKTIR